MKDLQAGLEKLRQVQQYRHRRSASGPQQPERTIDGRQTLGFCSNDYLGLANHPDLIKAFKQAADRYGVGSGSAHLINGHTAIHHELENRLAEFTGHQRALLFSTGYMANLGVISALMSRGDQVLGDRLNHASLIDAAKLSGAQFKRYQHNDLDSLQRLLRPDQAADCLIATDGVFSMDGDLADLAGLSRIAKQSNAWLMVDDAHGIGVLGENGRGTLEALAVELEAVPILMGTLGKALGTAGAFVAGSETLIEFLIQHARTYIFTTAMPAAVAAATLQSLRLVDEEPIRRQNLKDNINYFRHCAAQLDIALLPSETPIQAVVLGDNERANTVSEGLLQKGLHVTAIRPPTVPAGTARLRITLSAQHQKTHIEQLLQALSVELNLL